MEKVCGVRGAREGGVPQGVEEQVIPAEAVHAAVHAAGQDDLRHQVRQHLPGAHDTVISWQEPCSATVPAVPSDQVCS